MWVEDPVNSTRSVGRIASYPTEDCATVVAGNEGVCGGGRVWIQRGEGANSESNNATSRETGHSAPVDEAAGVEYRLHEFGLLAPSQSFAHWPGFSLNPALWDLERLDGSYRRRYGRKLEFDSTDIRSDPLEIGILSRGSLLMEGSRSTRQLRGRRAS